MFGFALSSFLGGLTDSPPSWWICALVAWGIVAVLGVCKVDLSAKVLGALVALEFLVVIVYDLLALTAAPEGITAQSLAPSGQDTVQLGGVGGWIRRTHGFTL